MAANTTWDTRVTYAGTRVCNPMKTRISSSPTGTVGQRVRERDISFLGVSRSRTRLSGRRLLRVVSLRTAFEGKEGEKRGRKAVKEKNERHGNHANGSRVEAHSTICNSMIKIYGPKIRRNWRIGQSPLLAKKPVARINSFDLYLEYHGEYRNVDDGSSYGIEI